MALVTTLALLLQWGIQGLDAAVLASSSGPNGKGAIRLVQNGYTSPYYTSGVVQVWLYGQWGNICYNDLFGYNEADVLCHHLGWSGASDYTSSQYDDYANDNSDTALHNVDCAQSSYINIFQCTYSTTYSSYCTDFDDVSITCYFTRIWDDPYDGQIRLRGGEYSNQGLVEVYCNGEWGTICDDYFGLSETSVICHQLGYNYYYNHGHLAITGHFNQSIWLDKVDCPSSYTFNCIGSCASCPGPRAVYDDCSHSKDVTVECSISSYRSAVNTTTSTCSDIQPTLNYNTNGPGSNYGGAIRLIRDGTTSPYYTSGVVQVWWNGQWGNICNDDSFGSDEADVVCRHLGWSGASHYTSSEYDSYENDNAPTSLRSVSCALTGFVNIFQCYYYDSSIFSPCNDDTDVSVTCYSTRIWDDPYDGQIRLRGGEYSNQGLVEVYCNGEWGTICDNGFGHNEARVTCYQLGYNDYYRYDHLSITGGSSQKIWLDDVQCDNVDDEDCIIQCAHCPTAEYHDCDHSEDMTIECAILSDRSSSLFQKEFCFIIDFDLTSAAAKVGAIIGGIVGGVILLLGILVAVPIIIAVIIGCYTVRRRPCYTRVTDNVQETESTTNITVGIQQPVPPPPQQPPPLATYPTVQVSHVPGQSYDSQVASADQSSSTGHIPQQDKPILETTTF